MREIDCDEARSLADADFDGELDAVSAVRFAAHLESCPACAEAQAGRTAVRAAIRGAATRHTAPAALRDAILKSLEPPAAPASPQPAANDSGRFRRFWGPSAGFVVGAALAASLTIVVDRGSLWRSTEDFAIAAHIRALQPGHLTDVEVSDQHQVKPWFNGRIDFSPEVKDLTDQGFDLVGGRLDYLAGREAAVVVYRRRLHVIDLFVTRQGAAAGPAASRDGYNIEHWSDGGRDYWAVSDLNAPELAEFAAKWRARG